MIKIILTVVVLGSFLLIPAIAAHILQDGNENETI